MSPYPHARPSHWLVPALVHLCALLPLLRWLMLGLIDGLGAHPQEFLIRSSGLWALVLLMATLSVTPLRRLGLWPGILRYRRTLGLYTASYTLLHTLAWAVWDQGTLAAMWADLWTRDFIGVGALAALGLVPLVITSTQGWMRRLGRRWKHLHRLIYPVAILSVLHFDWMRAGKNDLLEPRLYALGLAVLLGLRLWWRRRG